MAETIRIGLVGLGKIARDQHLPALDAVEGVELVAVASRNASHDTLPSFDSVEAMLASGIAIDAVSLCTPPQGRFEQAAAVLAANKHLILEKPPGATLSEVEALKRIADEKGLVLFATWHSRFAPQVEAARAFLADAAIRSVSIEWKEDVRKWHPGQQWIWEPGGLGVFDPGINALSIATRILPRPFRLVSSDLFFPENRAAPIAASLMFRDSADVPVSAEFDWRQTGPQTWTISAETDKGAFELTHGGTRLVIGGAEAPSAGMEEEYRGIYRRFVELARTNTSDADFSPFVHVCDAFTLGRRRVVEAFHDEGAAT